MSLVEVALQQLGRCVREETGKNDGAAVEEYQRSVGLLRGDPWCAAFVAWCARTASGSKRCPAWASGSVATMWMKSRKLPQSATSADVGWVWCRGRTAADAVIMRQYGWRQGHCGIIVAVDELGFETVEGNTNEAGSREGDGVYLKRHPWTDPRTVGFFNPSL